MLRSRLRHPPTSTSNTNTCADHTHTHTIRTTTATATARPQSRRATQRSGIRARQLGVVRRERGQIVPQPPARYHLRRRPQQGCMDVVHRRRDLHAAKRRERAEQRARFPHAERGRVHVVYHEYQPPPLPLLLPRCKWGVFFIPFGC